MKFIITDTPYVKFVTPKAYIFSGAYDKCAGGFGCIRTDHVFAKIAQTVQFVDEKKAKKIKQALNKCIRENTPIDNDAFDCDWSRFHFWKLVKSIKEDALFLCRNNGPRAFIGQDEISAEGYVFSNEFGMIKRWSIVSSSVMLTSNNAKFQQSV